MRTIVALLLVLSLLVAAPSQAREVQGERFVKEGQDLVVLWGTHADRGYAAGYLLGDEAVKLFRAYVTTFFGWAQYAVLVQLYDGSFTLPPEFETEAAELLIGARDAGVELYQAELGRDLAVIDLAIMSSIPDLDALMAGPALLCSSISAWGSGLRSEPGFDGELVHARNLDWSDTPQHELAASTLVLVSIPAEADEQPWVSLTFPGMWGALSAMNGSGVGVTLDMGNYKLDPTFPCDPILMTMRTAIEKRDPNGDGSSTIDDIAHLVSASSRGSSYILHCFMRPADAGADPPDYAVEANADKFAIRYDFDDPVVSPDFLLATNHHRKAYPPVYCSRYSTLQDEVVAQRPVDTMEAYDIVRQVSGGTSTLQSMILRPDPRDLFITHITAQGTQSPLVHFTWSELMDPPAPQPIISGPCFLESGQSAVLDAGAGYSSYLWNTGATTRTIEVAPTATTTYTVTVTDGDGWEGEDDYVVLVWSAETVFVDCFETGNTSAWSGTVR